MAEVVVTTCSAPGCSESGTNKCSSCKITLYCCVACQTIDWPSHKDECQGHLLKMGQKHREKAREFQLEQNWPQSLCSSDLALIQLKKLKACPLEVILIMDGVMALRFNALNFLNRTKESMECAQERYSLWAAGHMRHAGMLNAAFGLMDGLIHNQEYEQAHLIAHTANEMIINDTDNIIPEDRRQYFLAKGAKYLAQAIFMMAMSGGIAPEAKEKVGEEAIPLARKALEIAKKIDTQLYGTESCEVAACMDVLAEILKYFNGVDDDENFRLRQQAIVIYRREQGHSSLNVAVSENNLGNAYYERAVIAVRAKDLDRCMANTEMSLTCFREAERIYRVLNRVDKADKTAHDVAAMEEKLRWVRSQISAREVIKG